MTSHAKYAIEIAKPGDTIAHMAWRFYGNNSNTHHVFNANPGLWKLGPMLPAGLHIKMPIIAPNPERITLW